MTDTATPLDHAHAAMQANPDDDQRRTRYYEVLADTELCLLLRAEAEADAIDPEVVMIDDTAFVLAFDAEERLAAFTGAPTPYAALSGRVLAAMLADQGAGLAVNPDHPSAFLIPPDGMQWLVDTLDGTAPQQTQGTVVALLAPGEVPGDILDALADRLGRAAGLAQTAYLVQAEYDGGARMPLLAILGAEARAEAPLAQTVAEALTFSGYDATAMDVVFLDPEDARMPALTALGLRLDIPAPEPRQVQQIAPPGSDPDHPPRLR